MKLALVENEYYPCERKEEEEVKSFEVKDVTHMMQIVSQWYEVRRQSYMEQWKEMDVVEWGVCWEIAVQGVL